jgi:hypothetical protein
MQNGGGTVRIMLSSPAQADTSSFFALIMHFSFPLGEFVAHALDLAFERKFSGGADAVYEENAEKVISLMLNGAGEKPVGFYFHMATVEEGNFSEYDVRARHIGPDVGETQTTFVHDGFVFLRERQFRIHEDEGHHLLHGSFLAVHAKKSKRRLAGIPYVYDGELDIETDLRRSQAHTVRSLHGFKHVSGQGVEIGSDFSDRAAFLPQHGVTVENDFANHKTRI